VSPICRLGAAACAVVLSGCSGSPGAAESAEARHRAADADSGFVGVQARGREAMGVDQYTSTHLFEPLPDGGRIELQRDVSDSAGRAQIMAHMGRIAAAFATGIFTLPGFVHAREVPGTKVMAGAAEVGEMRSGRDGSGIAQLRLEALDGRPLRCGEAALTPRIPDWMVMPAREPVV